MTPPDLRGLAPRWSAERQGEGRGLGSGWGRGRTDVAVPRSQAEASPPAQTQHPVAPGWEVGVNTTCPGSVFPSQGHGVSQGGESTPGCGVKSPHKAEGLHPEDTQTHRITETACTFPSSPYLYTVGGVTGTGLGCCQVEASGSDGRVLRA